MNGIFCYNDPKNRDLAVRLVNAEGKTYDLESKAWSGSPAKPFTPLKKDGYPDAGNWQVCALPPLSQADAPVVAFVHPAAGGAAVDGPQQVVFPAVGVAVYGIGFFG